MYRYDEVRAAFKARVTEILEGYLKEHWDGREPHGDWYSIRCPLHEDTNASCSLSKNGGDLNCHGGCGHVKLFEWWSRFRGLPDEAAGLEDMATLLGVEEAGVASPSKPSAIKTVNEASHKRWMHALWDDPAHHLLREALAARGFERRHLEDYELGAVRTRTSSRLVFPYFQDGELLGRCKSWTPQGSPRWQWHGDKKVDCAGLWPRQEPPPDVDLMIVEGEWDCLAVREIARWPVFCYAWNGGASYSIEAYHIPFSIEGRKVYLCFDVDVWQGPNVDKAFVPHDQKRAHFLQRHGKLIETARVLEDLGADVHILTVPIDPKLNFKGDIRDWINDSDPANFDELPCTPLWQALEPQGDVIVCPSVEECVRHVGKRVSTRVKLSSPANEDYYLNLAASIVSCMQDQGDMCKTCPVSQNIDSVDWTDKKTAVDGDRVRATSILVKGKLKSFDKVVLHDMIRVPVMCRACEITHFPDPDHTKEAWWIDNPDGHDIFALVRAEQGRKLSPGDDIEIEAIPTMTHDDPISFLSVSKYNYLDPHDYRLKPEEITDLELLAPGNADCNEVSKFLIERSLDLTDNVTKIYGQDADIMHMTVLLVLMSSLWVKDESGDPQRGWGDVAIVGRQGSGKSLLLKRMRKHFGVDEAAYLAATPHNWSPAGITIGMEQRNVASKQYRAKPGLFPRNNGKCIMIDEFHSVTDTDAMKDEKGFMSNLQSARSDGVMSSAKMGAATLPSAVRLITVSNNSPESKEYRCEEVMDLYKRTEQVRRLDSAMWIERYDGPKSITDPVPNVWTHERCERLMRRAWAMKPDDIIVTEGAEFEIARLVCEWTEKYKYAIDRIPLFGGAEKSQSLRRMAVSVANMCFSHPEDEPHRCLVTEAHVIVAANWFDITWNNIDYDRFAADCASRSSLADELECEKLLIKWGVRYQFNHPADFDENEVINVLDMISHSDGISFARAKQIIGKLPEGQRVDDEALQWQKEGLAQNLWLIVSDKRSRFGVMNLTSEGRNLLKAIKQWCAFPKIYAPRAMDLMRGNTEDMQSMGAFDRVNRDLR